MSDPASTDSTRVTVIGGGPAGYAAAFRAADLGLEVSIIDDSPSLGGVCLQKGCIPSKALLHIAQLINETAHAAEWGITFERPKIDLDKLRAFKDSVIGKMTGGLDMLAKSRHVTHIKGRAMFANSSSIVVTDADGTTQTVDFDVAILATGSRPTAIPGMDVDHERVFDSTSALALASIPESLLVVGGGYIGLEMGTVYDALGSKVTVVEMMSGLLPGADRDLVKILEKRVKKTFESVQLETKVADLSVMDDGVKVVLERKDGSEELTFERALISIGRRPNSENLGLENTAVKVSGRGFVEVDDQRRTADPAIYAIGDIAGDPMLAHKGAAEGLVAAEAIAGHKVAFEPQAIPAVVFTDPEIAWCGITETEAEKTGRDVKVTRFPWAASGRATSIDRNDGVTKLVLDPATDRVIGVGICGVGAGELIAEGTLAVEMGALASDVQHTIHAHPTLSEAFMESGELAFGPSTHLYRPPKR